MHFDAEGDGLLYSRFSYITRENLNFGIGIQKEPN